jgi:hypothetical protein
LYAIFICFDNEPRHIRARLSRREDVFDDDTVELVLDTFHDHRRAYAFFSNPLGVQADALWTEGQDFDMSFDTVFETEAKITRFRGQDGHPLPQPAFCLHRPANLGNPAQPEYPAQQRELILAAIFEYHTLDHEGNHLGSGYFPAVSAELVGQTFLMVLYAKEMELLRPRDFSVLTSNQRYVRHTTEVKLDTSVYRPVSFHLDYRFGSRVNYDAPDNVAPFLAGRTSVTTTLTVRPSKSLRVDNTYLLLRLHNRLGPFGSMNNHIIRSKWNYQYNKRLSLRFIGQYDAVLANPAFTFLETTRNLNTDFLITYLVHPSTALYVGYNSNLENVLVPLGNDADGQLLHGGRLKNDGRGLFVKASYLFRF